MTVLGGLQVDGRAHLANWMIQRKMIPGMGGAMDLAMGAKRVVVAMQHVAKGKSKIVIACDLPPTSARTIDLVVTDWISRWQGHPDGNGAECQRRAGGRQYPSRTRCPDHGAGNGYLTWLVCESDHRSSEMRVFNDFNDLKGAVGTEVGVSDWMEITQDRINRFAEATGDEQWIHVDTERAAREAPGGITIAHGLLSLSLIPMLIREIIGLKVVKNTLNYGANRIRYLTPVPAGSRLRGRVEVIAAEDVPPNALRVTYKVTIEIEGGKRPACVAEVIGQHYR